MLMKAITISLLLLNLSRLIQTEDCVRPCQPIGGKNQWLNWEPDWPAAACEAKNGDNCVKVQTRKRIPSFDLFGCADCKTEEEERPCEVCQQGCDNGVCSCNTGYTLNQDNRNCTDVNECHTNNGDCEHVCHNSVGSFTCSCNDGYSTSSSDSSKCTAKSCGALNTGICPSNSYRDNKGDACKSITTDCTGNSFTSKCTLNCPQGYSVALIDVNLDRKFFAEFVNESDFLSVKKETSCILDGNKGVEWNVGVSNYYCRRLNDSPRDLKLSSTSIEEQSAKNSVVGVISSFDNEQGTKYTVETSEGEFSFHIDGDKLKSSKIFLRKDVSQISVNLRATDAKDASYFTSKTFIIQILNINDPPKEIEISNVKFSDLTHIGETIGNLTAVDYDVSADRSGAFTWTLLDNANDHFKIVGNSLILNKLYSDQNTDFAKVVKVQCTDNDTNPKSSEKDFTLQHKNKNNPVQMTFSNVNPIPESTAVNSIVGQILIVDAEGDLVKMHDLSNNGPNESKFNFTKLNCSMQNHTTHCSSDIVLVSELDYETHTQYQMTIEAVDEHNEKEVLNFKLKVTNVNEPPTSLTFGDISVPEEKLQGQYVGSIKVEDPEDNIKECIITTDPSPFEIRSPFNIILKDSSIDFEKKNKYSVTVKCIDNGGLAISTITEINIKDVNELPGNPCKTVQYINHTTPIDSSIFTLQSNDPDNEGITQKQHLTYKSTSSNVPFKLVDGKILVNGTLTPKQRYSFDVTVKDDGVLQRHADGGLERYTDSPKEKTFTCRINTYDFFPCPSTSFVYANGLCSCKDTLTGLNCDRDGSVCENNPCAGTSLCASYVAAPKRCIEKDNQLPMLFRVSSNKFASQNYRDDLENYIKDIIEGNSAGKSMTNLKGTQRKRRATVNSSPKYYIEIAEQLSIKAIYTYVRFVPYQSSKGYKLTNHSSLCPLFDGTDVHCLNDVDCKILKSAGISCTPADSRRVGGTPVDSDKPGPAPYTYIVPIAIILIIVVVILFLLYRRRNRPIIKEQDPVIFNNHTNDLNYSTSNQDGGQKPLNNHPASFSSGGNQTLRDIHRHRQLTDVNEFDSEVFKGGNRDSFEVANPAYGLNSNTVDPNAVNYRENRAFIEDPQKPTNDSLTAPSNNPLYASIGKSAQNPLYQSSVKDKDPGHPKVVDLVEEQKSKEKEYALIDDIPDPHLREIRRGASLNVFNPQEDNGKDKTINKKLNLDDKS